ncbi:MAG: hypothetical protein J5800_02545 [Spirochaetales bacterium]|nr:hypothetical protein [Spirochaetales bacterium]
MKKFLVVTAILFAVLFCLYAAEPINAVSVTVATIVKEPVTVTPSISVGINTAMNFSYYSTPGGEQAVVTDLDLTEDGSFTFSLLTTEEINIFGMAQRSAVSIEIEADGFHLYEEASDGLKDGFSLADTRIKERNAVPITSFAPEISIPNFSGSDENVSVNHVGDKNNKIEVTFNPGKTRSDLVIGSFKVDWKGKKDLDEGIYKAEVMVVYSTF